MPIHDWTRVGSGIFHDFHLGWVAHLQEYFNRRGLPEGCYALVEQRQVSEPASFDHSLEGRAINAVRNPPQTTIVLEADEDDFYTVRRRTVAIRVSKDDRVLAEIEIVAPGVKRTRRRLASFVEKAVSAISGGYHLLLIDLFPPGRHDLQRVHGAIWDEFGSIDKTLPEDRPLTLASYVAGLPKRAYIEPLLVGDSLPEMPLFLNLDHYVRTPLEETYEAARRGIPSEIQQQLSDG